MHGLMFLASLHLIRIGLDLQAFKRRWNGISFFIEEVKQCKEHDVDHFGEKLYGKFLEVYQGLECVRHKRQRGFRICSSHVNE